MQNSKHIFISLVTSIMTLMTTTSCENLLNMDEADEKIVVEGWIDCGDYPIVMLSKNITLVDSMYNEEELLKYLVNDASVRVVCGNDTATLKGTININYFPPFTYTTKDMKGEAGKSYKLIVDTSDGLHHLEATTTVPKPVYLDSLCIEHIGSTDTLYQVRTFFRDNKDEDNYYKIFVKTLNDTHADDEEGSYASMFRNNFLSSRISVFDDSILGDTTEFIVTRGFVNYAKDFQTYFIPNDKLTIKFAQIDRQSYIALKDIQHSVTFGGMVAINASRMIHTNVTGGLGTWIGYGASYYDVVIPGK